MTPNSKFSLKNVKSYPSRNGFSLLADLYVDGKWILTIDDAGDGGEAKFYIEDFELVEAFDALLESLPELYNEKFDVKMKVDRTMFIDLLHFSIVEKRPFSMADFMSPDIAFKTIETAPPCENFAKPIRRKKERKESVLTTMTKAEICKMFGCTMAQLKAQYMTNAEQMAIMLKKAQDTGKKVNGFTAEKLKEMVLSAVKNAAECAQLINQTSKS